MKLLRLNSFVTAESNFESVQQRQEHLNYFKQLGFIIEPDTLEAACSIEFAYPNDCEGADEHTPFELFNRINYLFKEETK